MDVERVQFSQPTLPILYTSDVVVVGGSFAGIAAALALAGAGRRVVLVEPRTYLGRECTATLRPWLPASVWTNEEMCPQLIRACIAASGIRVTSGEIPLKLDAIKLCLEDLLLAAGVDLLYASLPVGVVTEEGRIEGLIVGNKSGRQILSCPVLIDATETAAVARVTGATFEPAVPGVAHFRRTLEFDRVGPLHGSFLPVPEDLELVGHRVAIHPGYRGQEHILVECEMELAATETGWTSAMCREIKARHVGMRLAQYLIAHVAAFQHAFLATSSYELHGSHTPPLAGPYPDWALAWSTVQVTVACGEQTVLNAPLPAFAGPVQGLWCLQEAARIKPVQRACLLDPAGAELLGTAFAESLIYSWDWASEGPPAGLSRTTPAQVSFTPSSTAALGVSELASPQRGRPYPRRAVAPCEVPVLCIADVLVAGGGTSGATAAITAAREGMHTVLLELNPGLGGTGTLGGVDSYWFGRKVGFAARVSGWVNDVHAGLGHEGDKWNIEAKMYALLREVERAGVEVFWNAIVIGTVTEGSRVCGVVVASRYGPWAVLAQVVIDATGDGDVAAFAGADVVYGAARDHVTMWYSLAQFAKPGRTKNNFASMVDVGNVQDYTRAILAGRRRGKDCYEHGIYVAPRETRHVLGDVVLTLTDQLLHKRWPDVVNIHLSNHDIKGQTGSDWIRLGLIPPNLEVEVPYRALLPRGLEHILIAGKAISGTHDALPAIRMQADLENLGGVVALAAAQAVCEGVGPRAIDLPRLQQRLVGEGLLSREVLDRSLDPEREQDEDLEELIESLDAARPLYAYSDMEMDEVFRDPIPFVRVCTAGPRIVPMLEQVLAMSEGGRRVCIAQALSMMGSTAGASTLMGELERLLGSGTLPAREVHIRHANLPPDQGAMPDAAYLLYAVGMARDPRALSIWERVAELLEPTEENIRDRFKGVFYYVDAVCFGAERLGDPVAVPILEKLHSHPTLRDQGIQYGFQPDFFQERQAMLELAIGRALARCGSPQGVMILIQYLDDARALLAEQAHAELAAISGQDYGKDTEAWRLWLRHTGGQLRPCPVEKLASFT